VANHVARATSLPPVRNGLVRRFAFVAHKREEFHTDRTKAKLFDETAIGTRGIARRSGQPFHGRFGGRRHTVRVVAWWDAICACSILMGNSRRPPMMQQQEQQQQQQ
jgi:hypothetical protein